MRRLRASVASAHGGAISGVVGTDIAVLPDMSPDHEPAFRAAHAAVAEVGGPLAHLAIVSREQGRTLMVMPRACSLLRPGMRITLNPSRCEIRIESDPTT